MDTCTEWLPFALQVSDSLFPTGGYAHSQGLEALVQMGLVRDAESLRGFLSDLVVPLLAQFEFPAVRAAHSLSVAEALEELVALNQELTAWKLARESRQASHSIGTRRLQSLLRASDDAFLARMGSATPEWNHLPVFAAQLRRAPVEAALCAWWYTTISGYCAASLKLIRIGQDACQRIVADFAREIPGAVERSGSIPWEEAGYFGGVTDLAAMRHEYSNERLFIS